MTVVNELASCPIARTLDVVGDRWSFLVIREIHIGRRRFGDLRIGTGAATNVLASRLAALRDHGIVDRERVPGRGRQYEYSLTERGVALVPVLMALNAWGDAHLPGLDVATRHWRHEACGHETRAHVVCSHCHEELRPADLELALPGSEG